MNEKYHRLRAEDRKVIHNLRKGGSTQAAIAVAIGFTQGTVSKELSRNRGCVATGQERLPVLPGSGFAPKHRVADP